MPQPDKVVQIKMHIGTGLPVPDDDPIIVKKGNQKVKWTADFPFTIDIEDYTKCEHGKDGNNSHHCITDYFDEERKYKYSITANGKTNDPELDVKP